MRRSQKSARFWIFTLASILFVAYVYDRLFLRPLDKAYKQPNDVLTGDDYPVQNLNSKGPIRKVLIASAMSHDDTSWILKHFPDWEHAIYRMDDPKARLTVPRNKGRESTGYLTYLIDNYSNLPEVMVFIHGKRYEWHNEDPMYDGIPALQNLRLEHVLEEGYANLRCSWAIGCPDEIMPLQQEYVTNDTRAQTENIYAASFKKLFPGMEVPEQVGLPCGSQFALSRDKVHERPIEDYVRYRDWLWDSELPDSISGRMLEYSWHIIMGKPPVHCPSAKTCFCEKYGLCNLTCPSEGDCRRYILPKYANLPARWPEVGPGTDGWPERNWWKTVQHKGRSQVMGYATGASDLADQESLG